MQPILVSWIARNNDFNRLSDDPKSGLSKKLGLAKENGPTLQFHKHFYAEGKYSQHTILYSSPEDENAVERMTSDLRKEYRGRDVRAQLLEVNDVIDLAQIKTRVETWLLSHAPEQPITIFFSPGTSIMQLAWFICHNTLGRSTRLVQTRSGSFHASGIPEVMELKVAQSPIPMTAIIAEQQQKAGTAEATAAVEGHLIGKSLEQVYQRAEQVAQTDKVTVLIRGESGTGKERLAHYVHEKSARHNGPFRALNCAALTDTLLESRLFGHKKGAFTGADRDSEGEFKAAEGGTLFLDEIGDISPALQVALLRVLQCDEIQPLGGKTQKVNVRVIAATHAELEQRCEKGSFRWDLYYRLAVAELELPPLREWSTTEREQLLNHLIQQQKQALHKKSSLQLAAATRKLLLEYPFPGNIRELENMLTRLYVFALEDNAPVRPDSLPARLRQPTSSSVVSSLLLKDITRAHASRVLAICNGVKARAAKSMGIDVRTLDSTLRAE